MAYIEINANNGISIEFENWGSNQTAELKLSNKKDTIVIVGPIMNIVEELKNTLEQAKELV